jgi:3-phenylpropionate/trans-cinnamate dioxygenase ferredoxin reductase subunit
MRRSMARVAVVGGSLAGLEAARTLRAAGYDRELVVFSKEDDPPYDRPPLTKELLVGRYGPADVALPVDDSLDLDWRLGSPVSAFDAGTRTITTPSGDERFDGVIIATGAEPAWPRLKGADANLAGVHVVRTLADAERLAAELAARPAHVVVLGAGFIGTEVASSCRQLDLQVTVIDRLSIPSAPVLGPETGEAMTRLLRDHGVRLRLGEIVAELRGSSRVEAIVMGDDTVLHADVVVLAVGVRPAVRWLEGSGLELPDGVQCDETCLAAPGVVAAGDVARWPNRRFGCNKRVEHWDNAIRQARHAARTLLGEAAAYQPVPWFWSDQFGHKLQLAGDPAGYHEFLEVAGSTAGARFCGLYRRGDRVVAAVTMSAVKPFLVARALVERSATWAEALAVFERSEATRGSLRR